ncbi:MAG: hypothetical protein Q9209_001071 [Squamulea sp. 1 TL-2023]
MVPLSIFLGLATTISTFAAATPFHNSKGMRQLDTGIDKRQDVDGEDIETEAATDELRKALDYAAIFSAQDTVTYSAISVGTKTADAVQTATTIISPGNNAVGSPPDPKEQGDKYVVDHILELQFVVGAFQINPRPVTGATSIPLENWESASKACFTNAKNYAPKTAVATAFSKPFNLQGIPARFNGFKQQVFTGRIKSLPGNPSDRTYPSDFGPALRKFLIENEQGAYGAMDDVGKALAHKDVGNNDAIKDYFTAYAQGEWQSAIEFLKNWVGTSYTGTPATTTSSGTTTTKSGTITPAPTVRSLSDCKLVEYALIRTLRLDTY